MTRCAHHACRASHHARRGARSNTPALACASPPRLAHTLERACRNAYKALDVRDAQVPLGLERAKAQLRQLAQDASVTDPTAEQGSLITHGRGGPGYCLDLSAHRGFAATSPLVRAAPVSACGRGTCRARLTLACEQVACRMQLSDRPRCAAAGWLCANVSHCPLLEHWQ